MSKESEEGLAKLFSCLGVLGACFFMTLIGWTLVPWLEGRVMYTLWNWFVTPTFGMAAPSVLMLVGLMLVLRLALPVRSFGWKDVVRDKNEDSFKNLFIGFLELVWACLRPLFALGFGAILANLI